jgi:hypothetical protein
VNPHKNFTLLQIPNEIPTKSQGLIDKISTSNPIKRNRPPPFLHVFSLFVPHIFLPKLANWAQELPNFVGLGPDGLPSNFSALAGLQRAPRALPVVEHGEFP